MFHPILFILAALVAFFIPGDLFIKSLSLKLPQRIVISLAFGIVLWALQGLFFGFLNIRFFTYIYLIVLAFIWIRLNFNDIKKFRIKINSPDRVDFLLGGVILLGVLLQMSAVYSIGIKTSDGLFFCCRSVPDSIYHLSLTNELVKNFPPQEPGMAGVTVKNYHFLSNLTVAEIARVFKLPIASLQFRYMSFLLSIMLGSLVLVFASVLKFKKTLALWILIFLYFSGDILYLLFLLQKRGLNFSTTIIDDASLLLAGPTRAFSIVLLIAGLSLLAIYVKKKNLYPSFLMAIVFGSLIGFKVYTGIFAVAGLALLGLYYLISGKIRMILPLLLAGILSLVIYLPFNAGAGGLTYTGLWRFENFAASPGTNLQWLELSRLIFLADGKYHIVILFEVLFIFLYFSILFGTSNLAFLQTRKSLSVFPTEINIFLVGGLITSLIAGLFFIQKTGGANTIQFILNASLISSFYAGFAVYYWLGKFPLSLKLILALLIVNLTTSRSVYQGYDSIKQIKKHQGFEVSNSQLQAYEFFSKNTEKDSIIILPKNYADSEESLHIPYLSNRQVYLAGSGVLKDHGHDITLRDQIVSQVYSLDDQVKVHNILRDNNIDYLFLSNASFNKFEDDDSKLMSTVFQNESVKILKVSN